MNIFPIRFTGNYRSDYSVKQIIIESGKIDKYDIWKIHVYLLNNEKIPPVNAAIVLIVQSSWDGHIGFNSIGGKC